MGLQFRELLSEPCQNDFQRCLNSSQESGVDQNNCPSTWVSQLHPSCKKVAPCIVESCKETISKACCRSCFKMESSSSQKVSKVAFVMIMLSVISFVLACCYVIYIKFIKPRRIRSQQQDHHQEEERFETHGQLRLVDQDQGQGPVVDHHIWHIRTVGLQPSVISSLTVCKYKKGDGVIEGTECSVCLSEFEEDETLRLLPKCSHAFHIPCIDTWLTSHTNCPMCRAPIVKNIARAATSEANIENTRPREETQIAVLEDEQESDREMEGGYSERRRVTEEEESELRSSNSNEEEDGIQPLRRSVSLDSLSAFKIVQALANIESSDRNSGTQPPVKERGSSAEIVPKRAGGNQNLMKFMASSSFGRSLQIGPSSLKRSFSCSGKLFLSRPRRSRNFVLPS